MAQPTSCDGPGGQSEVESLILEERKPMAKKAAKGAKKKAAKKR